MLILYPKALLTYIFVLGLLFFCTFFGMLDENNYVLCCVLSRFSCVPLFAMLWTVAHQGSLSMGFSMQEYWSKLPIPAPGDLPNPWLSPHLLRQANSLPLAPPRKPTNSHAMQSRNSFISVFSECLPFYLFLLPISLTSVVSGISGTLLNKTEIFSLSLSYGEHNHSLIIKYYVSNKFCVFFFLFNQV